MEQFFNKIGKVGVAFLLGGVTLSRFFFVVDAGERGVIFNKLGGVKDKVLGEGMHFMIPGLWVSIIYLTCKAT